LIHFTELLFSSLLPVWIQVSTTDLMTIGRYLWVQVRRFECVYSYSIKLRYAFNVVSLKNKGNKKVIPLFFFFFFFFQKFWFKKGAWTLAKTPALFLWRVFWDRILGTICPGWFQIAILLISASWVTRITGMSYLSLSKNNLHIKVLFSMISNLLHFLLASEINIRKYLKVLEFLYRRNISNKSILSPTLKRNKQFHL
jgi:hypothetical protein